MEFAVTSVVEGSENSRKVLESLMPSFIEQLNLDRYNKIVNVIIDDIDGLAGSTVYFPLPEDDLDAYIVIIKPQILIEMVTTLAHELVHVGQLIRGQLIRLGEGFNVWCDKVYGPETAYFDQPWEIQAFSQQSMLVMKAIN